MNRREFLKLAAAAGMTGLLPAYMQKAMAADPYTGPVFIDLEFPGGIDQSCNTDPRNNSSINGWRGDGHSAKTAGGITYAPMGEYGSDGGAVDPFFSDYHDYILAINGIDLETNAHTVSKVGAHTGKKSEGYPGAAELFAAAVGSDLKAPWLVMRAFDDNAGLQSLTRVGDSSSDFRDLIGNVDATPTGDDFMSLDSLNVLNTARMDRLARLNPNNSGLAPYSERMLEQLKESRENSVQALSGGFDENWLNDLDGSFEGRSQKALLAFAAGISVSADVRGVNDWDTHEQHDNEAYKKFGRTARLIRYLWERAEEYGVANRLLVRVLSDVGRKPFYNSKNGKDHLNVGHCWLMMKPGGLIEANIGRGLLTNRTIGMSSDDHGKVKLNPATMQPDGNGSYVRHAHVQRAVRRLLGIENNALSMNHEFGEPEIDLLNPAISNPVNV